jgi:phage shock protein C
MIDTKRIYKSETDKRLWGVCGGLAEYFQVDPTLVRLLFIVLTLIGGPGVIIYIILGLVMPDAPRAYDEFSKPKRKNEDMI